jgi:hypothetical protein
MKEIYIHVSGDGSYLTQPVKNIVRADLVSATVSRTVPSITDGDYVILATTRINVPSGFYDQTTLISYINSWGSSGITVSREPNTLFTKITYPTAVNDALKGSSNVLSVLGFVPDFHYDTAYADGSYYIKSHGPGLASPTQVFLDIEELRHPYMNGFFATFPFDVPTGAIKVFSESSDLKCAVMYPAPLDTIHRITPRWIDQYRNPLQISGDFLLRLYCKDD